MTYENEMTVPYQGRIGKLLSSSIESIHVHMSPDLGQVSCGFKSQHLPIHGPTTAQYMHQRAANSQQLQVDKLAEGLYLPVPMCNPIKAHSTELLS